MAWSKNTAITRWAKACGLTREEYLAKIASGLKRCRKCTEWKDVSEYSADRSRYDGKNVMCRACGRVKVRKKPVFSKEHLDSLVSRNLEHRWAKGHVVTREVRETIRAKLKGTRTGEDSPNWKGGITPTNILMRESSDAKCWREAVFRRDGYSCHDCGDSSGGNLNAHHLKQWAEYPSLRFDVSNGITLCKTCHEKRHYKANSTRNLRRKRIAQKVAA